MPQIEELQTTAKAAAPGWSYVVDTGYDPSKVAINPTKRRRTGADQVGNVGALSLRQEAAIQKHLQELDKDNHKSEHIEVPKSKIKSDKKQSLNVRRVLASRKDFQHYLADEEALIASGRTVAPLAVATAVDAGETKPKPATRPSKTPIARRKSQLIQEQSRESSTTPTTPAAAPTPPPPAPTETKKLYYAIPRAGPPPPSQSILTPTEPLSITEAEIEALISAAPLFYTAAKSESPGEGAPRQRVFCEICGYWGRVRCMKCGARICGVECKGLHDESRCLKFYA